MALRPLYIEKVTIWSGVTDARQLTHWQTLKDRATQPLISRSGRNDPIYRRKPPNWKWQTIPRTFLDSVLVPPIGEGVGLSETLLFLDGNHSQVGTGGYMAIRILSFMIIDNEYQQLHIKMSSILYSCRFLSWQRLFLLLIGSSACLALNFATMAHL